MTLTTLAARCAAHATLTAPLPPLGAHLAVEQDGGLVFLPLADGTTTIGRHLSADIALDDHAVALRACTVEHADGRLRLRVGDHDAVRINGEAPAGASTDLRSGDRLDVGATRLHVLDLR